MKILIACEYSGIVRDAFIKHGHRAESCDILPTDKPNWTLDRFHQIRTHHPDRGYHWKTDIFKHLELEHDYDIMIAFPPCTHLAVSGARWFKQKQADGRQQKAIDFFMGLANADIPKIAIENPISIMSTKWRKPDQIIQPWQFGHGETKATCLWLKNLPKLKPTNIVDGREQRVWKMGPSVDRWKKRSRTYQGIANAMAKQWS